MDALDALLQGRQNATLTQAERSEAEARALAADAPVYEPLVLGVQGTFAGAIIRDALGDVLQLQVNDVIRLDGKATDPLGLRVGNRVKFLCQAGLSEKHYAGSVLEVVQDEGLARQEEE